MTESIETAERLFIEDFDTWGMTGYYQYSKLLRSGVSAHIGTGGSRVTFRTTGLQSLRRTLTARARYRSRLIPNSPTSASYTRRGVWRALFTSVPLPQQPRPIAGSRIAA